MYESLSSEEWTYWQAYFRLDPWTGERADMHAAMLACVMANAWRGKGSSRFKLDDFLLKFGSTGTAGDENEEQSPEDMVAIMQAWAAVAEQQQKQGH